MQQAYPVLKNVPDSILKVTTEKTTSGIFVVAQAAGYNPVIFCRDSFGEFDAVGIPIDHLKGIVRKTGYSRCAAPASRKVPVITGRYRLLNDSRDYLVTSIQGGTNESPTLLLECMFDVVNPSNPQSHHPHIRLTRMAPFLQQPLEARDFEQLTVDFNLRMAKGINSQKKECISMLDSYIRMQNEFYRQSDPSVGPEKLLRTLGNNEVGSAKGKDDHALLVPNYSAVFFIVLIIAAAVVAGFILWRRYFQKPKVRRVQVSQARSQTITDV